MYYVHFKTRQIVSGDDATVAALLGLSQAEDEAEVHCETCTCDDDYEEYSGLADRANDEGIYADTLWLATQYLENEHAVSP